MGELENKEWYVAIVEYNYGLCLHTATSGRMFHGYSERARQNGLGFVLAEKFGYCPVLFDKLNGFNGDKKFSGKIPLAKLVKSLKEGNDIDAQVALDYLCEELTQEK